MKRIAVILILLVVLAEAKVYGPVLRYRTAPVFRITSTATPTSTQFQVETFLSRAGDNGPNQCAIDWTLPVTYENQRDILSCYRALYPNPDYAPPLCPPAQSDWNVVFNSSVCWAMNYGTPTALTATVVPPTPTIDLPPTETPAPYPPPAYP